MARRNRWILFFILMITASAVFGWRSFRRSEGPKNGQTQRDSASSPSMMPKPGTGSLQWSVSQSFVYQAVDLLNAWKAGAAVEKLSDAVAADPTNPQSYVIRANIFWQLGQLDLAIQDLTSAIEQSGQRPYYVTRCTAYFASGLFDDAIGDCSQAIQIAPTETDAYLLRAMSYFAKGDLPGALADGLTVLIIHPNDPNARHLVDEILTLMGENSDRGIREKLPVIKSELPTGL